MVPEEQYFARPTTEKLDEFGLPALEINIEFNDTVIGKMIEAREHMLCLMEEAGYKSKLRPVAPDQLYPGVAVHYGGTTRMHAKREHGVLDSWNRVWDASNVLVTDAGSFTTGAEKNPTLTLMALSARAADHLADELKVS
jgi:choline dehydrogenase-like flavoprotein